MLDIINPRLIEDLPKFCKIAEKLGYSALYIITDPKDKEKNKEKIAEAEKNTKIKLFFLSKNIIINCAGKKEEARHLLEITGIKMVYNLECHKEMDFMHHRNSGLNQVLCEIAHKKNKIIIFSFNSILNSYNSVRGIITGRMRQNVKLCRKYKVEIKLASFAEKPLEMRDAKDMLAFGKMIGMAPGEAKKALENKINL